MRALVLAIISLTIATVFGAEPVKLTIAIQPLGAVKAERLNVVKKSLEASFGTKAEILESKPLPEEAWYAPRSRYRAEKLLEFLADHTAEKYRIVVGVTAKDISTTKGDVEGWGIFGLGELDGRVCVASTYRLGARGADEAKLRVRLGNVVVHEVGHVMGLPHCPQRGCIMEDAEASIATVDRESGDFCETCKAKWQGWLNGKSN